jgi:pimeloyl-ACP methyl ester carboxylesterase
MQRIHWLDRAWSAVVGRPHLFGGGWGPDVPVPDEVPPIAPIVVRFDCDGGEFDSPAVGLPEAARRARFWWVPPTRSDGAVCVHLASTGDQGPRRRRPVAARLAARGIGSIILENPYYGSRRPPEQTRTSLRTVADQIVMTRATVAEARSLLAWLRGRGHERVAVAGFSMGGTIAGLTAAVTPFAVASSPAAAGISPTPVFLDGALSRQIDWRALGDGGRERFAGMAERAGIGRQPVPVRPDAAVLLGCRFDGYVPADSIEALHAYWVGSELRWVDTGHVGGLLWGAEQHADAIAAALDRL